MDPFTIASLATSGIKAIAGGIQAIQGRNRLKNLERPVYSMPQEVQQATNLAKQQANVGMAAASEKLAREQMAQSSATALRYGGAQANVGSIVQAQNQSAMQLAAQDAAIRQQNVAQYGAALQTQAEYRDQEFEYNQNQPYQQELASAQGMIGSGLQNIMGSVDTAAGALAGEMALREEGGGKGRKRFIASDKSKKTKRLPYQNPNMVIPTGNG